MTALLTGRPSLSSARCANISSETSFPWQRCQQKLRSEPMLASIGSERRQSFATKRRTMHNAVDIHPETDACWQRARPADNEARMSQLYQLSICK